MCCTTAAAAVVVGVVDDNDDDGEWWMVNAVYDGIDVYVKLFLAYNQLWRINLKLVELSILIAVINLKLQK